MHKKPTIDRKQKRVFRRMLFLSLLGLGLFLVVAGGTFAFVWHEKNKPLYVSPLASLKFVQAASKDRKMDQLKKELKNKSIEYSSIEKIDDSVYVIALKNNGKVTISMQKDIIAQIASLQYILSHLTMEGKLFSQLDLRFEKPVVVLK